MSNAENVAMRAKVKILSRVVYVRWYVRGSCCRCRRLAIRVKGRSHKDKMINGVERESVAKEEERVCQELAEWKGRRMGNEIKVRMDD